MRAVPLLDMRCAAVRGPSPLPALPSPTRFHCRAGLAAAAAGKCFRSGMFGSRASLLQPSIVHSVHSVMRQANARPGHCARPSQAAPFALASCNNNKGPGAMQDLLMCIIRMIKCGSAGMGASASVSGR